MDMTPVVQYGRSGSKISSSRKILDFTRRISLQFLFFFIILFAAYVSIAMTGAVWLGANENVPLFALFILGILFVLSGTALLWGLLYRALCKENAAENEYIHSVYTEVFEKTLMRLGEPVFLIDPKNRSFLHCNPAAERLFDFKTSEIVGQKTSFLFREEEESEKFNYWVERVLESKGTICAEFSMQTKGGDIIETESTLTAIDADNRQTGIILSIVHDVTCQKQAEQALRISEAHYRTLLETIPDLIWVKDPEGKYLNCNRAFARFFEIEEKDIIGKTDYHFEDKEKADFFREHDLKVFESGQICSNEDLLTLPDSSDSKLFETIKVPMRDHHGEIVGLIGISRDISRRSLVQGELQHQKDLLEKSQELGHIGTWEFDLKHDRLFWTSEINRIFEIPEGTQLSYSAFLERVHPDDRNHVIRKWQATLNGDAYEIEHRLLLGEKIKWVRQQAYLEMGPHNQTVKAIGYVQDITARKIAEDEKDKLEKQLQHAQKIESIGRLAGGVAHDYNNMLSVIIGNSEIAQIKLNAADPVQENLDEILKAATRSKDITQKLLVFARKQNVAPTVLNLNETVDSILSMLRQLIGENIELIWQPKDDLWPVKIDPSQLDQLLANLCVNARDAISDIGKIIIETDVITFEAEYCQDQANFMPGEFVMLAVSDNGCGMEKEIIEHIFEPFFSTKPIGTGTGLGLATVYGVVKQNNGFINVYSEVGKGTTFKIYLPRHLGTVAKKKVPLQRNVPKGQGETILIVEDEVPLLKLMTTMLVDLDYEVLVANSPRKALDIARCNANKINLLVTDMIMPEMNGEELAKQIRQLIPGLRCLFISGYTETTIEQGGFAEEGINFLNKPFSREYFVRKIHNILQLR